MLDKDKVIEYLQNEIDSCKTVGNFSDKAIIWECERILKRIELGMFDSDSEELEKKLKERDDYWLEQNMILTEALVKEKERIEHLESSIKRVIHMLENPSSHPLTSYGIALDLRESLKNDKE